MHHHTERITHTTAFVTPVVEHWLEREIAIIGQINLVGKVSGCEIQHVPFETDTTGVTKAVVCAILSVGWCM